MSEEIMVVENAAIEQNNVNISDFAIPRGYICTVNTTTMTGKLKVMNALNGATPLAEHMNEDLKVKDIVTTSGVRSRTGEDCVNTYLLLDNGRTLFSQSDGVARAIGVLVALFTINGKCDFGNGVKVQCIERKLNNGNTLKTIVPVL